MIYLASTCVASRPFPVAGKEEQAERLQAEQRAAKLEQAEESLNEQAKLPFGDAVQDAQAKQEKAAKWKERASRLGSV